MAKCIGCGEELPIFPGPACPGCGMSTKKTFEEIKSRPAYQDSDVAGSEEFDQAEVDKGRIFFTISLVMTISIWACTIFFIMLLQQNAVPAIIGCFINFLMLFGLFYGFPAARYVLAVYYLLCLAGAAITIFAPPPDEYDRGPLVPIFGAMFVVAYVCLIFLTMHPSMTEYAKSQHQKQIRRG